ncbi:MAG: Rpn family recombination-promoting nuclease/putative transposase [Oscillospiraceae bacterium]|nr:Rpn family recombination-promoting nuclease/putative transposase [Oscillospiraceae bacterium]
MAVKDTVTAKYMRKNEIFADAFNFFVYNGRQVIDPASLQELDAREIEVPYGGDEGAEQPVQRTRDAIKSVTAMSDRKRAYLILAIENQSNIHYAMPVKNLMYDAIQYATQVEKAAGSHRRSGGYRGISGDEYLSGFLKSDRLMPVMTLVVYFGPKVWDGPLSLHEMFQEQDGEILSLVPDYKINLLAPAAIEDSVFDKFNSTLKEVLSFIKYSRDGDKLEEVVNADEEFRHLGRAEVDVLNACVGANLTKSGNEEVLDVCQAIQTIQAKGRAEGRVETLLQAVKNLMQTMGWTADQTMDNMKISEADRKAIAPFL